MAVVIGDGIFFIRRGGHRAPPLPRGIAGDVINLESRDNDRPPMERVGVSLVQCRWQKRG